MNVASAFTASANKLASGSSPSWVTPRVVEKYGLCSIEPSLLSQPKTVEGDDDSTGETRADSLAKKSSVSSVLAHFWWGVENDQQMAFVNHDPLMTSFFTQPVAEDLRAVPGVREH